MNFMPPRYQTGGSEDSAVLVVHMTPESVLQTDQYKEWMERCAPFKPLKPSLRMLDLVTQLGLCVSAGSHPQQNT